MFIIIIHHHHRLSSAIHATQRLDVFPQPIITTDAYMIKRFGSHEFWPPSVLKFLKLS